jgi:hypothetical protein
MNPQKRKKFKKKLHQNPGLNTNSQKKENTQLAT